MKKTFRRWYEKNEYLKVFLGLLEDLSIESQCEIAVDIIVEASKMIDRDYEKIIKDVSNYNPKDFNRWYDKNPNLHLAIESLRDLDDDQLEKIIQEFSDRIISSHYIRIEELDDET